MTKVLSTFGMISGIVGALILSLNLNMFILSYVIMLLSALSWVVYSIITKQTNLLILNSVFSVINIIGIVSYSGGVTV